VRGRNGGIPSLRATANWRGAMISSARSLRKQSTSTRRSVPVGARQLFAVIAAEEAGALRRRRRISPAPSPVTASVLNSERRKTALVRNPISVGERR
jgi:hypothetical protein